MEVSEREILRILDANLNRAREGMRVVEDLARFVFEDKTLQKKTKALRHKLASLFTFFPQKRLSSFLASRSATRVGRELLIDLGRDALTDVGKNSLPSAEGARATAVDLVQANFSRIEESVRALEEYTKCVAGGPSQKLKALRFETYSLEKQYIVVANRASNTRLLQNLGLYPIIDRETIGDLHPLDIAREILVHGVRIVQYRDKVSPAAEVCEVCSALREITARKRIIFILNDRVDIVQATDADGVHLGQDDIPVALARRLLGSRKIIGKSTHSLAQARRTAKEDVDYIAVGPIFSTPTKPRARPVGVELIARVRKTTNKPIIAIGGISGQNLREVLQAGADGAAVISAILKARSVRSSTRSLLNICRRSLGRKN